MSQLLCFIHENTKQLSDCFTLGVAKILMPTHSSNVIMELRRELAIEHQTLSACSIEIEDTNGLQNLTHRI